MELTQLCQFQTVARCATLTQAARELHISQPALSTAIKKLEAELGTPLFDRRGNRLALNPAGELALQYANRVLESAAQLTQAMADYQKQNRLLRGGFCDPGPKWYCTPLFELAHPDLELRAQLYPEALTPEGELALLHQNTYDFLVTAHPLTGPGVVCKPYLRDRMLLSVPAASPLAAQPGVCLRELALPLLLVHFVGGVFVKQLQALYAALPQGCKIDYSTEYFLFAQKQRSSAAPSVSTTLTRHYRDDGADRVLIPTTDPELEIQYYLCYLTHASRRVGAFAGGGGGEGKLGIRN